MGPQQVQQPGQSQKQSQQRAQITWNRITIQLVEKGKKLVKCVSKQKSEHEKKYLR